MDKPALRSWLRAQLRNYAVDAYGEAAICARVRRLLENYPSLPILGFLKHFPAEIDLEKLFIAEQELGREIYLPVVDSDAMSFRRFDATTSLEPGYGGIREPRDSDPYQALEQHVLVLLPGLVFGRNGYRVGRGMGHYDRFLAKLHNPIVVGVCWNFQLLDFVPSEPHDRPVNAIVTEIETFLLPQ